MNTNLKYFRETVGLHLKDIASHLNVTSHTYAGYEAGRITIPSEIIPMLSLLYSIEESEFYVTKENLKFCTLQKLYSLSTLDIKNRVSKLTANLLGDNSRCNYKNIQKVKESIIEKLKAEGKDNYSNTSD